MHSALRGLQKNNYIELHSALRERQKDNYRYIEMHSALRELQAIRSLNWNTQAVPSGNC